MLRRHSSAMLLAVLCTLGSRCDLFGQQPYTPLRTQVYGGTYATPAYVETVATVTRPTAPYDLFAHTFQENYPHCVDCLGLAEFFYYRLEKRRPIEIGRYAEA